MTPTWPMNAPAAHLTHCIAAGKLASASLTGRLSLLVSMDSRGLPMSFRPRPRAENASIKFSSEKEWRRPHSRALAPSVFIARVMDVKPTSLLSSSDAWPCSMNITKCTRSAAAAEEDEVWVQAHKINYGSDAHGVW